MKKLLCLSLILLLSLSIGFSLAATSEDKTAVLHLLSVMEGDGNGNYMLDRNVTRAEMTKMVICVSDYRNLVAPKLNISPFPDVSYQHWSAPYIHVALTNGLVSGYEDATFRPDQTVTYEEGITMLLRVLGYTNGDFGDSWPYGQIGIAQSIGLTDNTSIFIGTPLTRRDCMELLYNLLLTPPKNANSDYIQKLGYTLHENAILLATSREDSSVGATKISTSAGTFENKASITSDALGAKGDALCYGNDLMLFFPYKQTVRSYIVYQVLADKIVVSEDGALIQLDTSTNPVMYNKINKTTLGSLLNSLSLGDTLTYYYNEEDLLDYGTISTGKTQGPFIAASSADMQAQFGACTVYRDSMQSSADALSKNDVYYYNEALNTVFAYSKKVTGIYESASPNRDQPQSVKISGTTYALESVDAVGALSSRGSFSYGDSITLLLGKDGAVAGVVNPEDTTEEEIFGYVTDAGKKQFSDTDTATTTSYYITLAQTSGQSVTYKTKFDATDFIGKIVSVSFSSGYAIIQSHKTTYISGTIDAENYTVGSYKVAKNVQLLEYLPPKLPGTAGSFAPVFFSRLDGVSLAGKTVYIKTNGNEITEMIFADITGDLHAYAVVTSASGGVTYDTEGISHTTNDFHLSKGQFVKVVGSTSRPTALSAINSLNNCRMLTRAYVVSKNGTKYTLSDKVVIYEKNSDGEYFVITLEEALSKENAVFTAAYDRSDTNGGRVRIIVFES